MKGHHCAYTGNARAIIARAFLLVFLLGGCYDPGEKKPDPGEPDRNFDYAEGQGKPPEGVKIDTAAFEAALRMDTTGDRRTVARRIEDASLAAKVRSALVQDRTLRPYDFQPTVLNGIVRLDGKVVTAEQREHAEKVAMGVEGTRAVLNAVAVVDAPKPAPQLSRKPIAPPTTAHDRTASKAPPPKAKSGAVYHTVRSGESMWTIARRYGVSVAQIQRLNGGRSAIRPGQKIRVK